MDSISSVLFDADGVIQETTAGWLDHWKAMVRDPGDADEFVSDIFTAERPHLLGLEGFEDSLHRVMQKWKVEASLSDVLYAWTLIEPSEAVLAVVSDVRAKGTQVALATNQQQFRHQHMMESLRYDRLFDAVFVSCEMKAAKPSSDYFNFIINQQGLRPTEFLFIDDNERNVETARNCGMNAEQYHLSQGIETMKAILDRYEVPQ
jgi:putative hydrolase of the HAD superfamily